VLTHQRVPAAQRAPCQAFVFLVVAPATMMWESQASRRPAMGRRDQLGSSPSTGAGNYRNQTTGEPFSWGVLGEVMPPVVLQRQACQECRMDLFEAMSANPDNAGLRAQFDQAVQELVEARPQCGCWRCSGGLLIWLGIDTATGSVVASYKLKCRGVVSVIIELFVIKR
jgi:hypothetical protein